MNGSEQVRDFEKRRSTKVSQPEMAWQPDFLGIASITVTGAPVMMPDQLDCTKQQARGA